MAGLTLQPVSLVPSHYAHYALCVSVFVCVLCVLQPQEGLAPVLDCPTPAGTLGSPTTAYTPRPVLDHCCPHLLASVGCDRPWVEHSWQVPSHPGMLSPADIFGHIWSAEPRCVPRCQLGPLALSLFSHLKLFACGTGQGIAAPKYIR